MQYIYEKYPYFLYYFVDDVTMKATITFCLLDVEVANKNMGQVQVGPKDVKKAEEIIQNLKNETRKYGLSINDEKRAIKSTSFFGYF